MHLGFYIVHVRVGFALLYVVTCEESNTPVKNCVVNKLSFKYCDNINCYKLVSGYAGLI